MSRRRFGNGRIRTGQGRFRVAVAVAVVMSAAVGATPARPALACSLDTVKSSRWSVVREHGVAWLKTPCGTRFYSLGVNIFDGGYPEREANGKLHYSWRAFAPSLKAWIDSARRRLLAWGFNSAGGWSLPPRQSRLPTVIDLELGRHAKFHWFDPFSAETEAEMMAQARKEVAPYRGSPYRIGYFSDNEVGWWAGALFVFYSAKPASSATKQAWLALVRQHYGGDWNRFAADFVPPAGVDSWTRLLASETPTHMRPGGNGIAVVRAWAGAVAERYYTLSEKAIRAADPDALYFGDRLPIYYDPAAVRVMAPHVDAIATNYNPDAGDGWIARYYFDGLRRLSGGKPVLVSEWFFAARENRTGNRNNGHLMTVKTQAERARGAAAATANFAAIPDVIGSHWFQYYDQPEGGRPDGEDYNFGLVDTNDVPYHRLIAALTTANRMAPDGHARATLPQAETIADFRVPHARISLADHSLSDWPKPTSLLPPLTPSPGAVDFGEIYLSWSRQGLAAATIGQDYFDLNLMPFSNPFPLVDAYRIELGVDAGAGPRRFTLFFIPGHGDRYDHQSMTIRLCSGTAASALDGGCTSPEAARAEYFGADQPRITAEMQIPWQDLGIAPPGPGQQIAVEVAMTSWYRERWMSLSGKPPESALADPSGWARLRLADGAS
jgi:hypothetical protein